MLTKIEIANYKAFGEAQCVDCAPSSPTGLTVLVGPNNSGKSTALHAAWHLLKDRSDFVIEQDEQRLPLVPAITADVERVGADGLTKKRVRIAKNGTDAYYSKMVEDVTDDVAKPLSEDPSEVCRYTFIPSRRPWEERYGDANTPKPEEYGHSVNDALRREGSTGGSHLPNGLNFILKSEEKKRDFDLILKAILPEINDWSATRLAGTDFIQYTTRPGAKHRIGFSGDGVMNVFRLSYALLHLKPDEVLAIDEPELSLHPQAQKRLYRLLAKTATTNQVILATHSTYFVNWRDLIKGAHLYRVGRSQAGDASLRRLSDATINKIKGVVEGDFKNRRLYDALAKEMFFADAIVFCEGQEDIHYISNYLDAINGDDLPLFGYGSGGAPNIEHWLRMAQELGIRAVGWYDGEEEHAAKKAEDAFAGDQSIKILRLPADDIRDKEADGDKAAKSGVFRKSGEMKEDKKAAFDDQVTVIRKFLVEY